MGLLQISVVGVLPSMCTELMSVQMLATQLDHRTLLWRSEACRGVSMVGPSWRPGGAGTYRLLQYHVVLVSCVVGCESS